MLQELGPSVIPVIAILCTFLFLTIWVIAATIESLYKTSCQTRLKERLVERGITPSEIDQILRAGATDDQEQDAYVAPVPPVKSPVYPLSS